MIVALKIWLAAACMNPYNILSLIAIIYLSDKFLQNCAFRHNDELLTCLDEEGVSDLDLWQEYVLQFATNHHEKLTLPWKLYFHKNWISVSREMHH